MEDVNKRRQIFLSLNISAVPKKSTPRKFAHFWHFKRIGINAEKFEKTRFHFYSDVFAVVAIVVGAKAPNCNEIGKIYSLWSLDLEGCSSLKLFSEARWSLNPLFPLLKELGPADVGVSLKKTNNGELITMGYFRVLRASVSKRGWVACLCFVNDFSFSCK